MQNEQTNTTRPVVATPGPQRELTIAVAVKRLEEITNATGNYVEELHNRFSPVLFNQPAEEGEKTPTELAPGCELGRSLMGMCDRLENNLRVIRRVIDSADF